jgi:hypothetical protein
MTAVKQWRGNHGRIVLELYGDALVKHERSKDRLRVLGETGHAIDEQMYREAVSLGARELFINEDSRRLVWRAKLADIKPDVRTIAGVRRRCFDLRNFDLVEGVEDAPGWYQFRPREEKPIEPPREQGLLFGATDYERRIQHEL